MIDRTYNIGGRDFVLAVGTQATEESLLSTVKELVESAPEDIMEQLKGFDLKKAKTLNCLFAFGFGATEYLMKNQSKLLACMIKEKGTKLIDRDLIELRGFIRENASIRVRYEVVHDFFMHPDIIILKLSLQAIFPIMEDMIKIITKALQYQNG